MNPDNGTVQLDMAEVGSLSGENNSVEVVFGNSLIWKKIGSYLNMVDLLSCRLVSSGFHAMVMKETNFVNRCLVILEPHQITRDILGSTSEPWKNVQLVFGSPAGEGSTGNFRFDEDELEWLYPILLNVESLSLRMKLGTNGGDFYPILKGILNAPNKLRALEIEAVFLGGRARDIEDWKDTFENLEEFQVLEHPTQWQDEIDVLKTYNFWIDSILAAFFMKMKNMRVLKCYYPKRVLADDMDSVLVWYEGLMLQSFLSWVGAKSSNTLKCMTLPAPGIWNEEEPEERFFPVLESAAFHLPITFQTIQTPMVKECLLALPMLRELDFTASTTLPSSILNAIGERSDRLRTLKIRSPDFDGTNWQFLKKTKIEEFHLALMESDEEGETLPDEALNCLPPTIKRLLLQGPLESNPIPALARLNPSLVTELTFLDSGECFTNDTIKYIRENFKMLRLLNVTNAERVTDAGFVASSESGSLSEIKGLKSLVLRGCGSITNATVKEIRFLELCSLDLSDNAGVTEEDMKEMLHNNPSLVAWLEHHPRRGASNHFRLGC